jgi:threonine-phosphate decarboxylase
MLDTDTVQDKRSLETGAGISPVGPSKKVKAAIRKAVKRIGEAPDPDSSRLRRSLSSRFGVPMDEFVFGNSIQELLRLILGVLSPKRVLVVGPAPAIYEEVSVAAGAEVFCLCGPEEKGFAVEIEAVRNLVQDADLLFIANPDRVSGRLVKNADMEALLRFTSERKVTVVLDESLIEFTGEDGHLGRSSTRGHLIVLRTTAFFHGLPGLELAYAVASPPVRRALHEKRCAGINILAQEAARTALKDKTYARLTRKYVHDEKALLEKAIGKIRGITFLVSDSNIFLIKAEGFNRKMAEALERAGFRIEDCADVHGLGPHFLRLSVMEHDRNKKFIRILREVVEGPRSQEPRAKGT